MAFPDDVRLAAVKKRAEGGLDGLQKGVIDVLGVDVVEVDVLLS